MELSRNHLYEKDHYYKRTYHNGDWIIFTVTNIVNDFEYARLTVKILQPNNDRKNTTTMSGYYPNATTVELSYAQTVSIAL